MNMKKIPLTSLVILFMLLATTNISAEDKPMSEIPGIESVKEANVKEIGLIEVGSKVVHEKLGVGVVKMIQLGDDTTILNVIFETRGSKWLVAEQSNLNVVNE